MSNEDPKRNIGKHSESVMTLARRLYETTERLDPDGGAEWDELPDRTVEFYTLCVEFLLEDEDLVRRALADYDVVERKVELPK